MVLPCLDLNATLHLLQANSTDYSRIRSAYMDIIEHSPDMKRYARWEYGKHPDDQSILAYIAVDSMYMLLDGPNIAGVSVLTPSQSEAYHSVRWHADVKDDAVMTLHLFGILPGYQGSGVGKVMIRKILETARAKEFNACRLDVLASNTPARHFYESLGFVCCGTQHWYAENTGWTDFCLYEFILDPSSIVNTDKGQDE